MWKMFRVHAGELQKQPPVVFCKKILFLKISQNLRGKNRVEVFKNKVTGVFL